MTSYLCPTHGGSRVLWKISIRTLLVWVGSVVEMPTCRHAGVFPCGPSAAKYFKAVCISVEDRFEVGRYPILYGGAFPLHVKLTVVHLSPPDINPNVNRSGEEASSCMVVSNCGVYSRPPVTRNKKRYLCSRQCARYPTNAPRLLACLPCFVCNPSFIKKERSKPLPH